MLCCEKKKKEHTPFFYLKSWGGGNIYEVLRGLNYFT
jgi:hypothetical protein